MNKIKTFILQFENTIEPYEIVPFRGAIINSMEQNNILFHNHTEEGFRYSYPLIQYKRINQKAAIVCIGEGTEAIGEYLSNGEISLQIGERVIETKIEHMKAYQTVVQCWNDMFSYNLYKWMALNQENYKLYQQTESLAERTKFLEKILIGNLMSFLKGVGIFVDTEIELIITQIKNERLIRYKGVKFMTFDIDFKTNLSIPDYIGIGKNASIGFGMIKRRVVNKTL